MTVSVLPYEALGDLHAPLFAKRYELFVEGRGWRGLERPDRLDIDRYDDADTTYIIIQIDGEIVGGARLRPTTKPHMLRDAFGSLCANNYVPTGPHIFECSRIFVGRRHPLRRRIWRDILLEAAEFCVERGITTLTGITELWQLNSYLACGLEARPLGPSQERDGITLLAVSFDVDDRIVKRLSEAAA